jgi:hypothetical protein
MDNQTRTHTMKSGWFYLFILLCGLVALSGVVGTARAGNGAGLSASATRIPANRPPVLRPATIITPTAAQDLAFAMGIDAADLISATLNGSDIAGIGIGTTPLGGFPTQGTTFAILSTGKASSAELPNNQGNLGIMLPGLNNSQGNDLVQLALRVHVPENKNCLHVDFKFFSEEFPEYVGHDYNDTFTAELGGTNIVISGNSVTAPLNFAYDTQQQIISVNTVFGVMDNTGTTYDGATPLLRTQTPVTPTATVDIVFSVQDLGDSFWDSAVFLDRFFWTSESPCGTGAEWPYHVYLPLMRR